MAFLLPPPPHFKFHSDSLYGEQLQQESCSAWKNIIKVVFSGGFAEICFHQNLEMFHLGRARGVLQTFKTGEGVKIDRNQETVSDFIRQ